MTLDQAFCKSPDHNAGCGSVSRKRIFIPQFIHYPCEVEQMVFSGYKELSVISLPPTNQLVFSGGSAALGIQGWSLLLIKESVTGLGIQRDE